MTDKFHKLPAVKNITSLSKTKIYNLIKKEEFPKPVPITSRGVAWSEKEIEAWQERQKNKRQSH